MTDLVQERQYTNIGEFQKKYFPRDSEQQEADGTGIQPQNFGATLAVDSLLKFSNLVHL